MKLLPASQQGFTLIEVMIALFVFAVGMLGLSWMQTVSKKSVVESQQRSIASLLAYDLAERMRANPGATNSYLLGAQAGVGRGTLATPRDCVANECNQIQMAAYDLWVWEQAIDGAVETYQQGGNSVAAGGLVTPTGCVDGPGGGGDGVYTVSIVWRGTDALSDPLSNDCGAGTGLYGANDEFRQIVTMEIYVASF